MGENWLRGIFPPIATAFTADGGLRPPPSGFFAHLRDGGLDGVVALGSNGEATHLTETERLQWVRAVRTALPAPLRLIVGTGAESTLATIERTRAAAAEVADASPIPILIYNVPVHMGYDLGAEWIVRLTGHRNVAGLKDSSGDIARLPGLRAQLGPDFVVLAGAGEKMVDALAAGADGAIAALANLAPAASAGIRRSWLEGRADQARQQQHTIAPLGEALTRRYGVPGLKAALRMLGYDHGDPRPPLPPLPAVELPNLRRLLEEAQLMPRALAS